jgi:hypothetical protein
MTFSVHDGKEALTTLDECSVNDRASALQKWLVLLAWSLLQPVSNNALERGDTLSTLFRQLAQRVSFNNPSLEPNKLAQRFVLRIPPEEGMPTPTAVPSLTMLWTESVALDIRGITRRAVFFSYCRLDH